MFCEREVTDTYRFSKQILTSALSIISFMFAKLKPHKTEGASQERRNSKANISEPVPFEPCEKPSKVHKNLK